MSPEVRGSPIEIAFLPDLRARGGRLLSGRGEQGKEVHAGSFLRERRIVLDSALRRRPRELRRVLTHEIFHFAWLRLGNPRRREWEALLRREIHGGVRGELGWSAELRKSVLFSYPAPGNNQPKWRDYACESFCDTAAWLYSGIARHREFTLAERHRKRRKEWFLATFQGRQIPI